MDKISISYDIELVLFDVNNPFTSGLFAKIDSIKGLEKPQMRTSSMNRPGANGGILSNQLYGGRLVTIEGQIYSPNLSSYMAARQAFIKMCRIDKNAYGDIEEKEMKLTARDGTLYSIFGSVIDFTLGQSKYNFAPFQLQFYASRPEIFSQSEYTVFLTARSSGGVVYPVIYPAVYEASEGGNLSVINLGNMNSLPRLYLSGQLTNPVISNITTGKYMSIGEILMDSDDTIEIDMRDQTILFNGTSDLEAKILGSDWWDLMPGTNLIQLTTGDSADDGQVSLIYRDAFVGF